MSVGVGSVAHQLIRKLLKTIHCFTVVNLALQFLTHPILFRSFFVCRYYNDLTPENVNKWRQPK
jgi:hypothetical protein